MEKFITKKKLGQNFLKNDLIIDQIVNHYNIQPQDLVLEIGPGTGALTKRILKKNCYLRCFEIDTDTMPYLKPLENDKVSVIYDDFLKINIYDYIKDIDFGNLYIIANLPYYITTPIIEHLINANIPIKGMLLMMQKEVADRICAKPKTKEYGMISVKLNYYFSMRKIMDVKNSNFVPVPKVDSSVVSFEKIERNSLISILVFEDLLKQAFSLKRKTLKNNLKKETFEQLYPILLKNGFNEKVRAEEIDLETFIEMSNELC